MKLIKIIPVLIFFASFSAKAQTLSPVEKELYDLIMEYRKQAGLPAIPVSVSLTIVAQTHAKDLEENFKWGEACNMHSWSAKGPWRRVCYTDDHKNAKLMWSKPRELTSYKGDGYEIAYGTKTLSPIGSIGASPVKALDSWQKSTGHNSLIVNKGVWKPAWNAIGIGIYGGYAVVWFGNQSE